METKWTIGVAAFVVIFCIFASTVPVKSKAYTEIAWIEEKYIEKEPYEVEEEYEVPVEYTYTAPCNNQSGSRYGYECCPIPGRPGGVGQTPVSFDPSYATARWSWPDLPHLCEYKGIRVEKRTRTVVKIREVERSRLVPREVTTYKKVPLLAW